MVMSRHELLQNLHEIIRPQVYLETGVQHGVSLDLAHACPTAIGIDPDPLTTRQRPNQQIFKMTSDKYFASAEGFEIDLAFIDGMHLVEFALRDFMNVEKLSHNRTIIVFDDVLPMTQAMAARDMCPGDWTGDVWKMHEILKQWRPDLKITLLDTFPTGTMVVRFPNAQSDILPRYYDIIAEYWQKVERVPEDVIGRYHAVRAESFIHLLRESNV